MYCKWMRLVTRVWKYTNIQYNLNCKGCIAVFCTLKVDMFLKT